MQNAAGLGALLPIGIDMRHDIVPHFFFAGNGHVIVDIVGMPSACSDSARAIHSLRQVRNFVSLEKICCMVLLAYLPQRGF